MKKTLLTLAVLASAVAANAQFQRMVVIEEMTGTGCGWCPRGLVGMDKVKAQYEDKAIGIALHQFNNDDPMYITKYAYTGLNGAPNCAIDRKITADPYYGRTNADNSIFDAIDYYASQETHACVESVTAVYQDEKQKKVDINATLNFDADGDYSVAYVLTTDSLTGSSDVWLQHNYYTQYSSSSLPADLAQFGAGGSLGQSTFSWSFNDVAITSSYNSSNENLTDPLEPAVAGVAQEVSYTLNLPTKTTLHNAIRRDLVFAIVLIIDNTNGWIANAARVKVENATTDGITMSSADTDEAVAVEYFSLDGKAVAAPQKGINVVRMSDGSFKKIMF